MSRSDSHARAQRAAAAVPKGVPTETFGQRIDSWARDLFPGWGLRRQAARMASEAAVELASYRGSKHTRIGRKKAGPGRQDWHLEGGFDRREIVDRARQLERSSWLAEALLSRSTENVMGTGFTLQAQTKIKGWNDKAEALWREWGQTQADVRGMSTFDELMSLTFRGFLRDGDVGTILLADGKLQAFESDQLSSPNGEPISKNMVDGIELDRRGKPRTYHIVTSPDPIVPSVRYQQHTPIPSESIIFLARRQRLGQTRGLSALSGSTWLFDQIDGNIEATTVAARMAASFGLVITSAAGQFPWTTSTQTADGNARPKISVEPGMTYGLRAGEDIKQIKPEQPITHFGEFVQNLVRFVAIPFGLPLELFYDFANTNFSNHKAAMLSSQRTWRGYQQIMEHFASQVYMWKIVEWIRAGKLAPRPDALEHEWDKPGWRWLDPVKEFQAAQAAVDAGFDSPSGVVQRQGGNFSAVQVQRKRDYEAIEAAGQPLARSTLTRELTPEPVDEGSGKGSGKGDKNDDKDDPADDD